MFSPARLDALERELRGHVLRRQAVAARPRAPALQQIERQEADVRADFFTVDRRRGRARSRGQTGYVARRRLRAPDEPRSEKEGHQREVRTEYAQLFLSEYEASHTRRF